MATTDQPNKQEKRKSGKRRYFRRPRKGEGAFEQSDDSVNTQPTQRARPKRQNRKRSENRRRSSARRHGSEARSSAAAPPRQEEERQPRNDVYIYTHITRPAYKDGGGEFYADHSLNLFGATASSQVGMDTLLESIGRQLDEWFQPVTKRTDQDGADDGRVHDDDGKED